MGHKPFTKGLEEKSSHRPARFAQRVKEELSTLIPGELKDPRLSGLPFFTITSVTVTPDLKHGTVMFSLMGVEDKKRVTEIEEALNQAASYLRRQLMHRIDTKITPQLVFKFDKGLNNTMEIDYLLKQIADEKKTSDTTSSVAAADSSVDESDDDTDNS